jgi:polynucleotide 5'-kinase involved in rRNA processing
MLGSTMLESIVSAVNPDYIVSVSRGDELDAFLSPYRGMKRPSILGIKTTSHARRRSPDVRRTRRELKLAACFAEAVPVNLPLAALGVTRAPLFRGKPLPDGDLESLGRTLGAKVHYAEESSGSLTVLTENTPARASTLQLAEAQAPTDVFVLPVAAFSGVLLGLVGESGQLTSLGIMDKFNPATGMARVLTPCRNTDSIRQVVIGSLRITPAGKELGPFRIRKIMTPRESGN